MDSLKQVELEESFAQMLCRLIKEKNLQGKDVQDELFLSGTAFWKLKTGKNNPSKLTVFAMAIALKLDIRETKDFLMKAGFAINQSSVEDKILFQFIINKDYDRLKIDSVLKSLYLAPLPGAEYC